MTKINITQAILEQFLSEEAYGVIEEVKKTDPFSLHQALKEANQLIASMPPIRLGTTYLMAAAGQHLSDWFSQPIIFEALGMYVDIRKIINSASQVEVFAQAIDGKSETMSAVFAPYANSELTFELRLNGHSVLRAEIFVNQDATRIEGEGELLDTESSPVGDLELFINRKDAL
ncbi:hypothetical protein J6I75_04720 [Pseudidiomarina sp. 1APP75-27a]|uniref:hypothetical protein n=1 Tax=Pseudidiomarina terrestris TaxID=2820060 RepID=UPI002B055790|nr:hypothetical protein [Pseudidiomarina sp. 1APP75-27a]MEA3587647.1 hypothetical protein [Pseudidiomarina sp. 1APP75-27a]